MQLKHTGFFQDIVRTTGRKHSRDRKEQSKILSHKGNARHVNKAGLLVCLQKDLLCSAAFKETELPAFLLIITFFILHFAEYYRGSSLHKGTLFKDTQTYTLGKKASTEAYKNQGVFLS